MTDNLRDRIILALLSQRCDLEEPCEDCTILAAQDADAVIRELGLRDEWALKSTIYTNPLLHPYRSREAAVTDRDGASEDRRKDLSLQHRYVTEWETGNG